MFLSRSQLPGFSHWRHFEIDVSWSLLIQFACNLSLLVQRANMSIALLPLEQADVPAYARLELKAFRSHPRIRMLWPRGYTDDLYAFYESNKNESLQDPECRMMKAVDNETGRIVAVSEWVFALDVEAQLKKDPVDPNATPPDNWPIDGNWPLRHFFTLNLEKWTKQYLKGKPYISMCIYLYT